MLARAAAGEWRRLSLQDLCETADVEMTELRAEFSTKQDVLTAFIMDIDREVLSRDFGFETEDTHRDRLFELLMCRLDLLGKHRDSIFELSRDMTADPVSALRVSPTVLSTMVRILEAAGISGAGPLGLVRAKGLVAVWLATLQVWLRDDSPDLAPTMAALDRHLRRAEQLGIQLDRLPQFCRGRRTQPEYSAPR